MCKVKRTDEQLDLMGWKMDSVEKQMVEQLPLDSQDVCLLNLLKSVSEVRNMTHYNIVIYKFWPCT